MSIFIPRYSPHIIPVRSSPMMPTNKTDLEKKLKDYIDNVFKSLQASRISAPIDLIQLKKELKEEISSFISTKCVLPDIHKKDLEQLDRNLRDYYNQNIKALREELINIADKDSILDVQPIIDEINVLRENLNQLTGRVTNSGLYKFSSRLDILEGRIRTIDTNDDLVNLKSSLQNIRDDYTSKLGKTNKKLDDFIDKYISNLDEILNFLLRLDNFPQISRDELLKIVAEVDALKDDTTSRLTNIETDILSKTISKIELHELLASRYAAILEEIDSKITQIVGPIRTTIDRINTRLFVIDNIILQLPKYRTLLSEQSETIKRTLKDLNKVTDNNINSGLITDLDNIVTALSQKINQELGYDKIKEQLNIQSLEDRLNSLEQNHNKH